MMLRKRPGNREPGGRKESDLILVTPGPSSLVLAHTGVRPILVE